MLVEGVLRVRLAEVVVFEARDELCRVLGWTRTVDFWRPLEAFLLSSFELTMGGCDLTGMLCTVRRVGPATERVDLMGVEEEEFSSLSGTI